MRAAAPQATVVGAGAGFAGDRIEPAIELAATGAVDAVVLECLAERTLAQALAGDGDRPRYDRRLRRRLAPLLPVAREHGCRVISNLGAADPAGAAREVAALASELGLGGLRVAAVVGDDLTSAAGSVDWNDELPGDAELRGVHCYLGVDGPARAIEEGADVVITGRVADAALFVAAARARLEVGDDALAGALVVGHLLECGPQLTGGNFAAPGGEGPAADDLARIGYPLARIDPDGTALIAKPAGSGGRIDRLTCVLQLLYEVHDPAAYVTPDAILDLSGIELRECGDDRVAVGGARHAGRPERLKASGYALRAGALIDAEIGFAGPGAVGRSRTAGELLALRLGELGLEDPLIDTVGIDSVLGPASSPATCDPPEVRVHASVGCDDPELAQAVEDELYALTLAGPAGGCSLRSEMRPRIAVLDGRVDRDAVSIELEWEVAR